MEDQRIGDEELRVQRGLLGKLSLHEAMDIVEEHGYSLSAMSNSDIARLAASLVRASKAAKAKSEAGGF